MNSNKIEIFTFCHDEDSILVAKENIKYLCNNKYYKIILSGEKQKELKEKYKDILIDGEGESISKYNKYLNELTHMYWLSKNYDLPEYIGIQHYRRVINCTNTILNNLNEKTILPFEGYPASPCDNSYKSWQQERVKQGWILDPNIRIINYENEDAYPKNIRELIVPYIKNRSRGLQFKYLGIFPKKVFLAMMDFFEPIIKHYISIIDSNKYPKLGREFGFISEYLYSHFINIYSKMFSYTVNYSNKYQYNPCGITKINAIPKRLIFIWLGKDVPDYAYFSMKAFKQINPDFDIMFIHDDIENPQTEDLKETLELMKNGKSSIINEHMNFEITKKFGSLYKTEKMKLTLISDCLRAHVLNKYGGIYLDCDCFPVRKFNTHLLSHKNFGVNNIALNDNRKSYKDIFFMGCENGGFSWNPEFRFASEGYLDMYGKINFYDAYQLDKYRTDLEKFTSGKLEIKEDMTSCHFVKHYRTIEWAKEVNQFDKSKIYSNISFSPINCFGSDILFTLSKTSNIKIHRRNLFSYGMFLQEGTSNEEWKRIILDYLENYDSKVIEPFEKKIKNNEIPCYYDNLNNIDWIKILDIPFYNHIGKESLNNLVPYAKKLINKENFYADIFTLYSVLDLDKDYTNDLIKCLQKLSGKKSKLVIFSNKNIETENEDIQVVKLEKNLYNSIVDTVPDNIKKDGKIWYVYKNDFEKIANYFDSKPDLLTNRIFEIYEL